VVAPVVAVQCSPAATRRRLAPCIPRLQSGRLADHPALRSLRLPGAWSGFFMRPLCVAAEFAFIRYQGRLQRRPSRFAGIGGYSAGYRPRRCARPCGPCSVAPARRRTLLGWSLIASRLTVLRWIVDDWLLLLR